MNVISSLMLNVVFEIHPGNPRSRQKNSRLLVDVIFLRSFGRRNHELAWNEQMKDSAIDVFWCNADARLLRIDHVRKKRGLPKFRCYADNWLKRLLSENCVGRV